MAAEERAKSEFDNILRSIDRQYEIIEVKWTDQKLFEIKFRTQIPRDNDDYNALCDEWVDLFSEATYTVWAKKISNTGPKIRFRKQYQNWTHGGKVINKELLFDSRRCKGTLDMKVLTDNSVTRRKNKHIRQGLNVVVKINFVHLHQVDTNKYCAFFVHMCTPLAEAPKLVIPRNERLPQLVAEMVQKGLNASPKVLKPLPASKPEDATPLFTTTLLEKDPLQLNSLHLPSMQQQTIQLIPHVTLQDGIKLELESHLPQYTQVVVGDMTEPLLMCQSLMFDASQVIPVSSHYVQIHSDNLQN